MIVRQLHERADRARDLLGGRLVKGAVDVVVVVVDEEQTAALDELAQVVALGVGESHRQVPRHDTAAGTQHAIGATAAR